MSSFLSSSRVLLFTSNKENKTDTLVYVSKLTGSNTASNADGSPFVIPSTLITPTTGKGTTQWLIESISIDDKYVLLTKRISSSYCPMYIVNISGDTPTEPKQIILPGATETEEETANWHTKFSKDPSTPHLIYLLTNAYSDFMSLIALDYATGVVTHITTPIPELNPLCGIPWETNTLVITSEGVFFKANVQGWDNLFLMPLTGPHKGTVIELRPDWEGGVINLQTDERNGNPNDLVLKLVSYRSQGRVVLIDVREALERVEIDDASSGAYICVSVKEYQQAAAPLPSFRTLPPKLLRIKSFDGLEISSMYYHPTDSKSVVPLVINIHGGPTSQSTSQSRMYVHICGFVSFRPPDFAI